MHNSNYRKALFASERIHIDFSVLDANFVFYLGRVNYSRAHEPLRDHIHDGMMEIVLIVKGRQVYTVGGVNHTVKSGELFVTLPDELHSTGHYPEDKSLLYYFILKPDKILKSLFGESTEGKALINELTGIDKRVYYASPKLKEILDGIIAVYHSEFRFKKTAIRNLVSEFLLDVTECMKADTSSSVLQMQPVLQFIDENIREELPINQLAGIVNLSSARFKMNFRKEVGIPPREYILRQKVETAKIMLQNSDKSITDIAYHLSFSSSQYFSTVFKRYTYTNPLKYRIKAAAPF